ncbi:hypothetical protein AB0283_32190 [Micromonospora vinacea]|uniref:hypothetical protein n=1 Tax=Micromonospora vinacea TaxID=709878 RepID=UPI00344F1178
MARVVRQISSGGEQFIVATANTRPERLGRPFTRWSIRKLADHRHLRAACRIVVGRERLRHMLHQHRITYVGAHFPQRLFGLR